jgi:hypothetical protein
MGKRIVLLLLLCVSLVCAAQYPPLKTYPKFTTAKDCKMKEIVSKYNVPKTYSLDVYFTVDKNGRLTSLYPVETKDSTYLQVNNEIESFLRNYKDPIFNSEMPSWRVEIFSFADYGSR